MNARGRAFLNAAPLVRAASATARGLALASLAMLPGAARAAAVPWSEAFAGESDTVIAIGARGELVRAPFHLASAETIWTPPPGEHLARMRVSPGGRIAWLSRAGDRDPTTLWVADAFGVRRVAAFPSLVPSDLGAVRYEPAGPTTADDDVRGARLLAPPRGRRGGSANALSFRGGDDAILFGSGEGLGIAFADTGLARLASRALVVALHPLEPAPIVLAEVLRLDETRRQDLTPPDMPFGRDPEGAAAPPGQPPYGMGGRASRRPAGVEPSRYLLYATATGVRVFPAGTLEPRDRWTASGGTVWWAEGRQVLAVEAHDPGPRVVVEDRQPVAWLAYDPGLRGLLRASGGQLLWRAETAGGGGATSAADEERVLLTLTGPITAVLRADGDAALGLVTADSLVLWTPATGSREAAALGGIVPEAMLRLAGGERLLAARRGGKLALHRFEAGRLAPLEGPALEDARVVASPGGGALIVYVPAARPPGTLHAWRPGAGWMEVANPGLIGWEPLTPR